MARSSSIPIVILLLAGAVFGTWALLRKHTVSPPAEHLGLDIAADENSWRVTWNPGAPSVRSADRGVLWIETAGRRSKQDLSAPQLAGGSVTLPRTGDDLEVRLEVLSGGRTFSESTLLVGAGAPESPAAPAPGAPVAGEQPETAHKAAIDQAPKEGEHSVPGTQSPSREAVPSPLPAPPVKAAESTVPLVPELPAKGPDVAAAPSSSTRVPLKVEMLPRVLVPRAVCSVDYDPMDEPAIRHAFSHIPVIGQVQEHGYKSGKHFTPARPVQKEDPAVATDTARKMTGEVPVELKVSINKEGRVTRVELLTPKVDGQLAEAAMIAVRLSRFEPARIDGRAVDSQMAAHFRFRRAAETSH